MFKRPNFNNASTIYWANTAPLHFSPLFSLFDMSPESVLQNLYGNPHLKKADYDNKGTYRNCPGLSNALRNVYFVKSPLDINVNFTKSSSAELIISGENSTLVKTRTDVYDNQISLDLDFGWLFFSEDSLDFTQTPPYHHNTLASKFGAAPVGSFNISNWFRPISPSFLLWPDIKELSISKSEPLVYFHFDTKKKIVFKPFMPTQRILDIASSVGTHSTFLSNLPLATRYQSFKKSKLSSIILKDIKANLMI